MIRRHPIASFVLIAYAITWSLQIGSLWVATRSGLQLSNEANALSFARAFTGELSFEHGLALLLFNLGQFGPAIAAAVLIGALYGRPGLADLARRLGAWRLPGRWYAIVFALPFALSAAALGICFLAGGFSVGPWELKLPVAAALGFFLYMVVFTGLAEEPGWRGFVLPQLQRTNTAARASWILGFTWGLWHVPFTVYFNREEPFVIIPALLGLTFGIVGWTMVNTWIYNGCGSLLLIVLLHGWGNTVQSYLVLSQPNFIVHTLYALVPWGIAIWLSRRYGDETLAEGPRRALDDDGVERLLGSPASPPRR